MCGICAYIGYKPGFIEGLCGILMLQNRGYDSCGVCSIKDDEIIVTKYASQSNITSFDLLKDNAHKHIDATNLIFHNRWSTHGPKTDINAHPHLDHKKMLALVHNGIIENYAELKNNLISKYNIPFISDTDSEVIVNLISVMYDKYKNLQDAIHYSLKKMEGTWGLVIMFLQEPDKLYCVRHGSPLLISIGPDFAMIASEQSGFCKYVNNYICVEDNDIIVLEKQNGQIIIHKEKEEDYITRDISIQIDIHTPYPYPHWIIREIFEQSDSSLRALGLGGRILDDYNVKLGGFLSFEKELTNIDNLILLGCGTSYNAGMHCLEVLKEIAGFNTVQLFDGSEFNEGDVPKIGKTALLFLSQSGETKDLYGGIEISKKMRLLTIGVINMVDSYIAREVKCGVYLNAGREVSVASTKVFTSQIIVLYLIAIWFAQTRNINSVRRYDIIKDLRRLPIDIKNTLSKKISKDIILYLENKTSLFILGKGILEAVAHEGALKIKEISYIHAEAYNSSALKHGPYALIDKNTPIIILCSDDKYYNNNRSTIEEIKSREGFVIVISDIDDDNLDFSIKIPKNYTFRGLLSNLPMQIIAYELALSKGYDPDKPRHLAKCVTV